VDAADRDARYPPEIEGAAYFLVSEALTNVLKHASAREVEVRLASDDGRLRVEVLDDGCGFDPAVVPQAGLRGLRDRIEALGGTLRVLSGPAGTRLSADLPAGAGRHV
jgi:signal transduction histidine kinase